MADIGIVERRNADAHCERPADDLRKHQRLAGAVFDGIAVQFQLILEQIRNALLPLELHHPQRVFAKYLTLGHVDTAVLEQQRLFDQLDRAAINGIQRQIHALALASNASTVKRTGRPSWRPSQAVWPRRSPRPPPRHGNDRREGGTVADSSVNSTSQS